MPPSQKQKSFSTFSKFFGFISIYDKIMFARHTYVMLKAGLSLSRALKILINQTEKIKFKKILQNVKDGLERGQSFASSLAKYPKVFSPFFVNIVKVGETSGKLEESLNHLAIKMKKDYDLTNKIRSAMMYPAVILFAMVVTVTLMLIYILPQLTDIFKEVKVQLPWTTRAVIAFSDTISNYGLYILLILTLLVIVFISALKSKSGRIIFHKIIIKLPILSPILKKIELAKFARTLNTLIISGVPIVKSFEITSTVLSNYLYKKAALDAASFLKKGIKIVDTLERKPELFPSLVSQMVAVGEETGNLDKILSDLATFYEEEVTRTMNDLASIIEPILLILLGIGVAIVALSVFSPIYSLVEQI